MGIQGLLPLLKSITVNTHVKHYAQQTFGVDAYVWLHRGAIACAVDLALGKPTTKYVDYAMHRVKMLQHYGVKPYIVFDGDFLPSKAKTEVERQARRTLNTKLGRECMARGNTKLAQEYFQKAIDITPDMALRMIKALQEEGIDYVVAPYEADAQLAYMERVGLIDGIITEDSDLLVFGCKKVLFKMNEFGECMEVSRARFGDNVGMSLTGWTDHMFRYMAILSGCDYLASIPGMGLKTAHRIVRKYKRLDNIFRGLRMEVGLRMPIDYEDKFRRADLTFLYQRVFCPLKMSMIMGHEPTYALDEETTRLIGAELPDEVARSVANGSIDPITKAVIVLPDLSAQPGKRRGLVHSNSAPVGNMLMDKFLTTTTTPTTGRTSESLPLGEIAPNVQNVVPSPSEIAKRLAPRPSLIEQAHAKKLKLFESSPSPPAKAASGLSLDVVPPKHLEKENHASPFFARRSTPKKPSQADRDLAAALEASVRDEETRQQFAGFENPVAFDVQESLRLAATSAKATGTFSHHFRGMKEKSLPTLLRRQSTEPDVVPPAATTGLPTPPNSQNLDSVVAGWRQKYSFPQTPTTPLPLPLSSSSVSRMGGFALSRRASSPNLRGSVQRRPFFTPPTTSFLSQPDP